MLGAWTASEWLANGKPTPVNFVELGPGTGLLMKDMLNVRTRECVGVGGCEGRERGHPFLCVEGKEDASQSHGHSAVHA